VLILDFGMLLVPIGNGDVACNVWVEDKTGDLLFYLAKSDVFDQNSQLVKVGRVRVAFDPPLWKSSWAAVSHSNDIGGFKGPIPNTIGSQSHQIAGPNGVEWDCSSQVCRDFCRH
jgi:hypothetical protein